jgi:hypothetical protein
LRRGQLLALPIHASPAARHLRLAIALVVALASGSTGFLSRPAAVAAVGECGIPTCTLTIDAIGNGSGTVKTTNSSYVPNGLIDCQIVNGVRAPGSVCSHTYGGVDRVSPLIIYYILVPAPGSQACLGISSCKEETRYQAFKLTESGELEGRFLLMSYAAGISRSGSGTGNIASFPSGISCGVDCAESFTYGTELTLTAAADNGSYFDHWSGACAGQTSVCHVTVTGLIDTTATFNLGLPPTASPPAPTPSATAKATVKPTGTPRPGATATPVATAVPTIVASASAPTETGAPATSMPETSPAPPSAGPSFAPATDPPATPVSAPGSDLTPIALAILGAGLLIAVGIGFGAFVLRRRGSPQP